MMTSMCFKPARRRGQAISIYMDADALALVQPWIAGRARSARVSAILSRYADVVVHRPQLTIREAGVLGQLWGPLAALDDVGGLWAELLERHREGPPLPDGVDAEELANKVRRLSLAERLGLLELADQVAAALGSLRERLAVAGVKE